MKCRLLNVKVLKWIADDFTSHSRAAQNVSEGRHWPAGRALRTPDLKQLTLYTSRPLRQASTLRCPSSTTAHPQLQLQQAASDVTSGQSEEPADVIQLQPHILSQSHQPQVAAHIRLGRDGGRLRQTHIVAACVGNLKSSQQRVISNHKHTRKV